MLHLLPEGGHVSLWADLARTRSGDVLTWAAWTAPLAALYCGINALRDARRPFRSPVPAVFRGLQAHLAPLFPADAYKLPHENEEDTESSTPSEEHVRERNTGPLAWAVAAAAAQQRRERRMPRTSFDAGTRVADLALETIHVCTRSGVWVYGVLPLLVAKLGGSGLLVRRCVCLW